VKRNIFERLEVLYLLIFILGAIIIVPTHLFPPPTFMYARFPHYLELMGPFLGIIWPTTFKIYHITLYILAIVLSFNVLGIVLHPRLKKNAAFFSLIGIFLLSLITLFLFFKFVSVNFLTGIIYGLYAVILLIANVLTYKVLLSSVNFYNTALYSPAV